METLEIIEPYLHHLYAIASLLNAVCCAYPLIWISSLKSKPKSSSNYYEVIKFSYFCMSFWMAYGISSEEPLSLLSNATGFTLAALCLLTYAWVSDEYKKVIRHFLFGVFIVLLFPQLHVEYLAALASVVTVRLYMFCWIDIVGLRLSKNWKKVDLVDCGINSVNTVAWSVYGLADRDIFVFAAFFFGLCMYLQIFSYYCYFRYFVKTKGEWEEEQGKDVQA